MDHPPPPDTFATPRARDPLAWLGRHAPAAMPLGLVAGLLLPDLAALARPMLAPAIIFMMVLSMLRIDAHQVARELRRPVLIVAVIAWMLLGSPLAGLGLGRVLGLEGPILTAVVLFSAGPPILAGIAFALMLGLRAELSLVVVVLATLVCPLTVPPLVDWLAGFHMDLATGELMLRLAGVVALATVASRVVRWGMGPARVMRAADHLDGLLVLAMAVFALSIMDGVLDHLLAEPMRFVWLTALAMGVALMHQTLPLLAWPLVAKETLATVAMVCGYRNMGIVMAALGEAVDPDIFLFFVVVQVPIYCLPVLMKRVFRRIAGHARAG
ncbi:MAG: hypothetical protein H6843_06265 [Rhodospirillaceae bacterium]|nr:hypothetical protein [Rhodospirillaceae bacterium]